MFRLIRSDPAADRVRRITFVPFLPDGQCVLIEGPAGPGLPAGEVLDGEDYVLDTVLRVPLQAAGFRYQHFRPFGLDGGHLYAWIEGAPYTGDRDHAKAELSAAPAEQAAARLHASGQLVQAAAVTAAAESYRTLDDQTFYADNLRTLQRAYLRAGTVQQGSGFGGDARAWRQARYHISDGISGSGTFLDVGCANGLLMESMVAWCAERGARLEPSWRRADLIGHHLARTVRPQTGRLLVSDYAADQATGGPTAAQTLSALGFPVAGQSSSERRPGRPLCPAAWIDGYA